MKKILMLLGLIVLPVVLYIACNPCRCPAIKEKYRTISSLFVTPYGPANLPVDQGVPVNYDSIMFGYNLVVGCTASSAPPASFFMSSAYACSCVECGTEGLKSKVKEIKITSDAPYSANVPANTPLNSFFKVQSFGGISLLKGISIDSVTKILNEKYFPTGPMILYTRQKPSQNFTHRFTLTIFFEDGQKQEVTTKPITWL